MRKEEYKNYRVQTEKKENLDKLFEKYTILKDWTETEEEGIFAVRGNLKRFSELPTERPIELREIWNHRRYDRIVKY